MRTIILPNGNEKDLADIPEKVREDLTIHTVDSIDEVLKDALEKEPSEEIIETPPPPIRTTDQTSTHISANIE